MFNFLRYFEPCVYLGNLGDIELRHDGSSSKQVFSYRALHREFYNIPPYKELYYAPMYRIVVGVRTDYYPLLWIWVWVKIFVCCRVWDLFNMAIFMVLKNIFNKGRDFICPAIYAPRNPIKILYYFGMNQGKHFDEYVI